MVSLAEPDDSKMVAVASEHAAAGEVAPHSKQCNWDLGN